MGPDVVPLVDEGLGNSAYLVGLGDGRALAVDPPRDLRSLRAAADRRGWRVAFAAETHLHADFLTGALTLRETDAATVLASAAGNREYPHRGLVDGDEVDLGGLTLRIIATPGHTDEHLSYLLVDGDTPLAVFTGGSLIVGAAARTDLVSPERTEELARLQWRSLQRLATLPDEVRVWPTHGAGSFCSAPALGRRTSTIGAERTTNYLLSAESEDVFVGRLLGSLGPFPAYFLRLAEVNRRGPELFEGDELAPLTVDDVRRLRAAGAEVVDVRPTARFAEAHVPGSVSITLRPAFATWLGWLVPWDRPVVVVRDADQDPAEVLWQARKIGHDRIVGELDGGLPAWVAAGGETRSVPLVEADRVGRAGHVLDVREPAEYADGHLPGATHRPLGDLADPVSRPLPGPGPTVVMCGHGERAMSAASLLRRAGGEDVAVLLGGPEDWSAATGERLERGR